MVMTPKPIIWVNEADPYMAWYRGDVPLFTRLDETTMRHFVVGNGLDSPLFHIADDLPLEALSDASAVTNTRLFLQVLKDGGPVKLTQAGNLNRRFVAEMLDRMDWHGLDKQTIRQINKVINEDDVTELHYLHHINKGAGLIRTYKGTLRLTKRGEGLLSEANAGKLMRHLFLTHFQKFNAAYLDRANIDIWPQDQADLIIYLLALAAQNWQPYDRLMRLTTLPDNQVLNASTWLCRIVYHHRMLEPLRWYGLLEKRHLGRSDELTKIHEFRKTPLFDQFLSPSLAPSLKNQGT